MNAVIEIADQWTDRVNAKDIEGVLKLSATNVEISGPRGTAAGHDMLAQWVENSGIQLQTLSRYIRDGKVIYEQKASWENENGEVILYSFFLVKEGKVTQIARFDLLDDAFGASGMSEEDLV
ncbi:hypothetical protein BN1080_03264 [Planococcus massiliensis]|uniref:SnoaL-like domain protein n=1 Tax=Planococcus massiliensis TaxID=1499687 RepID=A0A098EPL3_9BACL|nr:hypothetical protein [Planococcus massiliensis]CEG24243.1 hypothetical protein BN1080_03264 [Planococcus massiliensis]